MDVLVFVHPHCPCTVATLRQIQRAQSLFRVPTHIRTLVSAPAGTEDDAYDGRVTSLARSIHDVQVVIDRDSTEARAFGAMSSGHVCIYDPGGRLRFSGGVTSIRSHEGDSPGLDAFGRLLSGETTDVTRTHVYGCLLTEESNSSVSSDGER